MKEQLGRKEALVSEPSATLCEFHLAKKNYPHTQNMI